MSSIAARVRKISRTGGGISIKSVRPRKKRQGVLSMLSKTPRRKRMGATIKSYLI